MFRRTLFVMVLVFVSFNANGQMSSGPPPVYAEIFQIDKEVGTRYVKKAVATNNSEGDHFLEFTAKIGEESERWTVKYHKDEEYEFFQEVSVDGQWRYSIKYADAVSSPRMTISTPALTAEIDVLNACNDSEFALFVVVATLIDNDRMVVHQVVDATTAQDDPPTEPENCVWNCYTQWEQPTSIGRPDNCHGDFACCVGNKMRLYCVEVHCDCPNSPDEDCTETAFQRLVRALDGCTNDYIECILSEACAE